MHVRWETWCDKRVLLFQQKMLQKAASACEDVVLGVERLLVGDKFLEGKTLLVGENLDLSVMYYENVRSALGSGLPFHEKSNTICTAFVTACVLVKPTFDELSKRKLMSLGIQNFDSFSEEMPLLNNESVALVSVTRNEDVDIDLPSGKNQMHASSFIYSFAKPGAKMALVAKVMGCFLVDNDSKLQRKAVQNHGGKLPTFIVSMPFANFVKLLILV